MSTVPIKTYSKAAVERRRLYLDYSCWLNDDEMLSATQVTISPYTSTQPLSVTTGYTDSTNKKLTMFVGGGIANNNYTVSVVVQTDGGQTKKDDIGIQGFAMSTMLFANNASSRLYAAIDAATTSIRVEAGDGAEFPQPTGGDYYMVTVEDRRTGQIEIMKCTGRSGDILNVTRGQEGMTPQAFAYGATVSNRLTAGTLNYLVAAAAVGEVPNDGKDYARHYQGWTVTISKVTYDAFVSSQANKDAAQDTQTNTNTANIATNTTNIATNASNITAIQGVNGTQDTAITNLQAQKVAKAGDTMSGPLVVPGPPTLGGQAANKNYVDSQITTSATPPATVLPLMDGAAAVGVANKYAREDHKHPSDTSLAPIASPTFTGIPAAPTATAGTNTTQVATTAFVTGAVTTVTVPPATVPPLMDGTAAVGVTTKYAREDHKHPSDTAKIGDAPNDGVQYVRQSLAWSPVNVPPGTVVSDAAPSSPQAGQMWLKSSTMVLYCWYVDPNTAQWVQVSASPQMVDQNYTRKTARRANLAINGALNVSQENGSTEGTTNTYYAADQWYGSLSVASAGYGFARIAAVNPSGSQFRLRFRVTTAKASLLATEWAGIGTKLEGLNAQDLGWTTTTPKDAVIQFGFNGPAGTYCAVVGQGAGLYTFVATFVVAAGQANTDTLQTIKVPAPSGSMASWPVDNTVAVSLVIALAAGSTFLAPAVGWNSGNFIGVTGMSNGLAAVQSFQIWDIGLYADPDKTGLAPTFEVEDYATTLAKCMRYWQQFRCYVAGWGSGAGWQGRYSSNITPMRVAGTAVYSNTSGTNYTGPTTYSITPTYVGIYGVTAAANGMTMDTTLTLNARM